MVIGFKFHDKDHNSRSLPLDATQSSNQIADQIMKQLFNKMKFEPIVNLSIAASKFIEECDDPSKNTIKLDNYFKKANKTDVFSSTGEEGTSSLGPKKLKSSHTTTLNDLWKASTSAVKTDDHSIGREVQIIDSNDSEN